MSAWKRAAPGSGFDLTHTERIEIGGFTLSEIGPRSATSLWRRGSFPLALLADSEADSVAWRKEFIQALLEGELPQWGVRVPRRRCFASGR